MSTAQEPPDLSGRGRSAGLVAGGVMVLALVLAGGLVGLLGPRIWQGVTGGGGEADAPPLVIGGNLEQRTDDLVGPAAAEAPEPAEPTAVPAAPEDPAASGQDGLMEAIRGRLEAENARLEERRRLASDAALTPPLRAVGELVADWNEARDRAPAADAVEAETAALPDEGAARPDPVVVDPPGAEQPGTAEEREGWLLARGSVVPAVLLSEIDSALPGLVRALVSEDVYDSVTGAHVLIPRGSRLTGEYGAETRIGQKRLWVGWTDLLMPDGAKVALPRFGTLGADGASGVRGRRSTGFIAALGSAILFDLAGNVSIIVGVEAEPDGDLAALARAASGRAVDTVAQEYFGAIVGGGPRFRAPGGTILNVVVEADLRLPGRTVR